MGSLYNIQEDILRIFNEVENNDGEITEELYNDLCIKQEELANKLDNYIKAIKEWQKDAEYCKSEKKSINARQNVYNNRVEKLKKAVLNAVMNFGEEGKTNKFIELPTCRIFTRASKSTIIDEERINLFINNLKNYLYELVFNGVPYTGDDCDIQGILDAINANCAAEYSLTHDEEFIPFTLKDLHVINIDIGKKCNIITLFNNGNDIINSYAKDILRSYIYNITTIDDCNKYENTISTIKTNYSLQIK